MANYDEQYQKGLIITDDIAIDPILDFNLYRNAIVNIIRNSYPKFTIGIFGDWGTGKSTLMDSIDKKHQQEDNDLVIVRFDTWRYELENQFALIPLLKTIEFSIPEEKYKNLKDAFKEAGKDSDFIHLLEKDICKNIPKVIEKKMKEYKN